MDAAEKEFQESRKLAGYKRKCSSDAGSSNPSGKHDLTALRERLENELLPSMDSYMQEDKARGHKQIEMSTRIGKGIDKLSYAQKDMAIAQGDMTAAQKEMTVAQERISTIQNRTGNVLSMMFQQMQLNRGK
jgi:hypothetical protein